MPKCTDVVVRRLTDRIDVVSTHRCGSSVTPRIKIWSAKGISEPATLTEARLG